MIMLSRLRPLFGLVEQAGRGLLDAFYPLECAGCGGTGKVICDRCADGLDILVPPFCEVCSAPGEWRRCPACAQEEGRHFDGIRAPFIYSGAMRQAILAFKYGGIKAAAPQLGGLLADYLRDNPLPGDVVTAVPMHRRRRRERGYNQAELLARQVSKRCGIHYGAGLLVRSRYVEPQAGTSSSAARAANVVGSVALAGGQDVSGAAVILVDDVATTGSTLEACAQALKEAGAVSVWGLALAVTPPRGRREREGE